jgi:hypothetical protein
MRRGLSLASSRTKHETVWDDARACSRRNPGRRSPHARLDTDSRSTFTLSASCCLQSGTKTACLSTHYALSPVLTAPRAHRRHERCITRRRQRPAAAISSPCLERPVATLPTELVGHCIVYAAIASKRAASTYGKLRRWHDEEIHLRLSRTCRRHLHSLRCALAAPCACHGRIFAILFTLLHASFATCSDGSLPLVLSAEHSYSTSGTGEIPHCSRQDACLSVSLGG